MNEFMNLGLSVGLVKAFSDAGITSPTDVQAKAIPLVLDGKDVLGSSATGSGKTIAFGAGIIEKINAGDGIQSLILTPTRELAEQISKNLAKYSKHVGLRVVQIFGGVSIEPQKHALRSADIVVGTPGRVLDHLRNASLNLSKVKFLVLDEADRMLDMGFIDDVVTIIDQCPKERQTLLFSATISSDISRIAKHYMKEPVFVESESQVDPSKLHQIYYDTPNNLKFSLLVHLLKQEKSGLVMVFCNTRRNADYVVHNLERNKIDAIAIHGGLAQNKRSRIMEEFHSSKALILVCTDVAARGLDVNNVSHVYNFDIPKTSIEYIHRIGRTARAGKEGIAISIVTQRDYDNFRRVLSDPALNIKQEQMPEVEPIPVRFKEVASDRDNRGRLTFGGRGRFSGARERGRSFGRDSRGGRSGGSRFGGDRDSNSGSSKSGQTFGRPGRRKERMY
ncbi:MAG: DEAD/DEAH box helicase [Nanoarchaeota archaeon]